MLSYLLSNVNLLCLCPLPAHQPSFIGPEPAQVPQLLLALNQLVGSCTPAAWLPLMLQRVAQHRRPPLSHNPAYLSQLNCLLSSA
jgi:hypothetical protein